MKGHSQAQWSAIVALSAAMLQHAEAGEWLALADLENQRRGLIGTDMQSPPTDEDCAAYAQVLQTILALDRQTIALAQVGQTALAKQLQGIAQGRNAVQAYAQQRR